MTHDDCRLWFQSLDDVFTAQGITSQINKFAAMSTLWSEDEAHMVRNLTMMGEECLPNVFDTAKKLFIERH